MPNYYLSEEENIILCGKIDWLEYIETDDSLHIIDFKTGKNDEHPGSLQLSIYHLLVNNCQNKKVSRASYWYLERNNEPTEVELLPIEDSFNKVLSLARKVKQARINREYSCQRNGCYHCEPFEAILKGQEEFVGTGGYRQDMYILK